MSGTLADRLRTIADALPPQPRLEVLAVAVQVGRMEAVLDEQVQYARLAAQATPRIRRSRATDRRP
jgi:hypothetical protein